MSKRILVVDDEPNVRMSFRYGLLSEQWHLEEASSGVEAIRKAQHTPFDLMILDLRMPGIDGLEVLRTLNSLRIRIPTVMVSAYATTDTVLQAVHRGTLDFVNKPATPDHLRAVIHAVFERFDFARSIRIGRPLTGEEKVKLAKVAVFEKRYPEAKRLLGELIGGPEEREALLLLGILHEIEGGFDDAVACYTKAAELAGVAGGRAPGNIEKNPAQSRWLFEHLSS